MEADAAAKDKKIADLQDARDAAKAEVAELRMSLQSAEASLAVQTAAVQRLEKQASVLMVEIRQARRSEEDWRAKGEEARSEVKALQIQLTSAVTKKEEIQKEMHDLRERLEAKIADLTRQYADAEARAKVPAYACMSLCVRRGVLVCLLTYKLKGTTTRAEVAVGAQVVASPKLVHTLSSSFTNVCTYA
jgi:chromosome segregation ATPase